MAKKVTLDELGEMMTYVVKHMSTKDYIERLDGRVERIDEKVDKLQTQVNSIEQQLRITKTEIRLADLEEEVFGKTRV
jgi:peptidoglycan hydrolase CwlO-like protein